MLALTLVAPRGLAAQGSPTPRVSVEYQQIGEASRIAKGLFDVLDLVGDMESAVDMYRSVQDVLTGYRPSGSGLFRDIADQYRALAAQLASLPLPSADLSAPELQVSAQDLADCDTRQSAFGRLDEAQRRLNRLSGIGGRQQSRLDELEATLQHTLDALPEMAEGVQALARAHFGLFGMDWYTFVTNTRPSIGDAMTKLRVRQRALQAAVDSIDARSSRLRDNTALLAQAALEDPDCRITALVITWQNEAGFWFAAGPVQRIQAGERSEEGAMGRVFREEEDVVRLLGQQGPYFIYSLDRLLRPRELNVRRVIDGIPW